MKYFFKKIIIENTIVIVSSIIVLIIMLIIQFINDIEPFGTNSLVQYDCLNQYYPYLSVLYDKLKNGENLFYYWNSGLGSNFLINYIFLLANPLNFFVVFVKKEHITLFITFLIVFKSVTSAGTFSFYLSKKNEDKNRYIIMALSCAYGLSNYVICYSSELLSWMDAYVLLPIIIYGFEKLIREKKPIIYILSFSFCAYCNFYPTFFIAIFLTILFLLFEHKSIKSFFIDGVIFAGASILAVGMTGFTIIITILNISKSYAYSDVVGGHSWFGSIFEVIRYQFIFSRPITVSYEFNHANLFCGTFVLVLIFIYIFTKGIMLSKKIKDIVLLLFLVISMNESFLNYFWHGMHFQNGAPNRFSFVFIFLVLNISYDTICGINKDSIKGVIIGAIVAEFIPMVNYFFTDFDSYFTSKSILLISLGLIIVYSILFIAKASLENKVINVVISVIMILEVLINAGFTQSKSLIGEIGLYKSTSIYKAVKEIKKDDDDLFSRSELPGQGANMNAIYGLNGLGIFSSWYKYETILDLYNLGYSVSTNSINTISFCEPVIDLFGFKYIVSLDNGIKFQNKNFYRVYDKDGISVYRNENAVPIIYASRDLIKDYSVDEQGDIYNNLNLFVYGICGVNKLFEEIYPKYTVYSRNCDVFVNDTGFLEFQYHADNPQKREIGFSFVIPDDGDYNCYFANDGSNYDFTVFVNDKEIFYQRAVESNMFSIGERKKGDDLEVVVRGIDENESYMAQNNGGICGFFIARVNEDVLNEVISYSKKTPLEIEEFKDGYIKGRVELKSKQVLFSSIPYDEYWHVYDNGNRVKIYNYAGFIGLDLGEGKHELELKYIPDEFYISIIISVIFWVLFVVLILTTRIKDKNHSD